MAENYEITNYVINSLAFEGSRKVGDSLLRTLEGVSTYILFDAGILAANKTVQWIAEGTFLIKQMFLLYAGAPSGTVVFKVIDPSENDLQVTLDVDDTGTKFDDAWVYDWKDFIVRKNSLLQITSSVAITGFRCFAKPLILSNVYSGTLIN